jgi:hypothetical protein
MSNKNNLGFCFLVEKPLKFSEVLNKYKVLNCTKTCAIFKIPRKPQRLGGFLQMLVCLLGGAAAWSS